MVSHQSRESREERAFLQCCIALRFVDLSTTPTWHVTQPARSDELREIARDPPLVAKLLLHEGARVLIPRMEKQVQDSKTEGSFPRMFSGVPDGTDTSEPENSQVTVVGQVRAVSWLAAERIDNDTGSFVRCPLV